MEAFVPPFVKMDGFERRALDVAGVETVVYRLGAGPPVVFLHGAGTFPGFDPLREWASRHTIILPYHPGFGESGDDATIDSIEDYVLHYMELFDRLGLAKLDLVGFSLGGWIAAEFALRQPERVRALVLAAPAGLVVPDYPAPDLSKVGPAELLGYLSHDPNVALRYFPKAPDPRFGALLSREMGSAGRIMAREPQGNPKLARWIHRITAPTLLVWGAADRMRPIEQGAEWLKRLPSGHLQSIPETGHFLFEEQPKTVGMVGKFLASA
jgi:pimeloyl-ACP methyl ester carboxylesterase